jgi:diaminohydroxyphosphoribosylaminopyrimidine deaminase/5-amino-6-(5-phosphoribosylamino)uracil reductase
VADDPQLTARCCGGKGGALHKQPLRVIIDGDGRTPASAQVFAQPGNTLLVLGREAGAEEKKTYEKAGAEILEMPSEKGYIELKNVFEILGRRQITSVLVEGGGRLIGSLFDQRMVDKVVFFVAPIIIGGDKATTAVGGRGVARVMDAVKLNGVRQESYGRDIMITGYTGGKQCSPEL